MSDLLNKASLVMVPSGYKEDTVYSVIPTDGSGDLSFTRASNGTRVNSDGNVEVVPWNLLEYSEDFSNGAWYQNNTTVNTNVAIAPNGTMTADRLTATANFGSILQATTQIVQIYTESIWVKSESGTVNGSIFGISSAATRTDFVATTTWQRITNTATSLGGTRFVEIRLDTNGTSILIWGAQLNIGSTAKPYFPTTDRLNVPRLTYQNGGGGCPSLLLEKQSTNEAVYSNALSTTPNVVDSSTTTANVYVSPDGTQNAMQFTETTATDRHGFYQYTTVTAQTYTASIFTKQTGRRYISFLSDMKGVTDAAYFDLQTKTAINVSSGYTCSVEDFGNGWLRLIVTFTATAGFHYVIWGGSPNGSSTFYAGSTSISQTFYGYQLEASSYATSYIPTTSTSATRVADACYKTGISSLIGQTEGTIFLDLNPTQANSDWVTLEPISGSPYANGLGFGFFSNAVRFQLYSPTGNISTAISPVSGRNKIAVAYKSGNTAIYINGTSVFTDTTTFAFSVNLDKFYLASASFITGVNSKNEINESVIFKTRLTNAELASLTTI